MALRRKNTSNQIQRLDRFIPTRESASLYELRSRQKLYLQYGTDTWNIKQNKRKKYMMRVDEAFGLEPLKAWSNIIRPNDECAQQSWPCAPRKKKCLTAADNVLDLPAYSHAPFPELLDWSYNNVIVAALGNKYYKWDFTDQTLISENLTLQWINCCKFDPTGELIALGTSRKIVEIHKLRLGKYLERKYCLCNCTYRNCSITALDWSPTGKSFVTGCSTGMITGFNQSGVLISCGHFEYNAILTVKISSNCRYVAVAGVNSSNVFIYTWPQLKLFSSFSCDGNVKSLAWHPWRSALLCVGIVTSDLCTQLALYDAPPGKLTEIICHRQHILDTMLFNNATGELVLSLWNTENRVNLRGGSLLLVLRDLETVVDHWGDDGLADLDQIRTMVFSPDGTKLATATASEDLMIWNFLPENQKRKNSKFYKPNRFTKIPTYLDQISTGYSVR